MPTITSEKDVDALTMTFTAHFDASVERVWQVWEDPRQLERWWGPPDYPATFERLELTPDGTALYYMTGPDGEKIWGRWTVTHVDRPNRLEFEDGFADADGNPDTSIDTTVSVITLESVDGGTRMTLLSQFPNLETLQQMVEMGMVEGMTGALAQIDAILAA
ncbi:uncharacterized protein YndB with AHSA1/START domain [Salinibacterium sp. CAN_S4]|uniref:SRPBCC family protein n=1 Tax=Salinibacterium sp. CAN_S4 TaxID=2787727 RepID=UPI0018F01B63